MNSTRALWMVLIALVGAAAVFGGCGNEDSSTSETSVAAAPPPSSEMPGGSVSDEQPMAPPGGEAPMRVPGGGPGAPSGPGGPGGPGMPPGGGFQPRDISGEEKAVFGPAGLPPIPGLGRPDTMTFEGDEQGGVLRTEMGDTQVEITYKASDAKPEDFGFTMPKGAQKHGAFDFSSVVPEKPIKEFLAKQAEMSGAEPPKDAPIPEADRRTAIRMMTYTMEGKPEEVYAAVQEAGGENHMPMGPFMFVSTKKEGAMAFLAPVEGKDLVQISLVHVMETPKAIASAMGPQMGRPGAMLRSEGPVGEPGSGRGGMGRGMMGKAPGGTGGGPGDGRGGARGRDGRSG